MKNKKEEGKGKKVTGGGHSSAQKHKKQIPRRGDADKTRHNEEKDEERATDTFSQGKDQMRNHNR